MYIGHLNYLIHLYYGPRVTSTGLTHLIQLNDRDFDCNPYEDGYSDRTFSVNYVRQEYSTYGVGDYRVSCLEVTNPDGSSAVDLRYSSHIIRQSAAKPSLSGLPQVTADSVDSLEITLFDKATKVSVVLKYAVIDEWDSITRSTEIKNSSPQAVVLTRALSAEIEFPTSDYDLISLDGNSQAERHITRTPLRSGKIVIDSLRGTTSREHNSFVALASPNADEQHGRAYGVTLLYSGNFVFEAEVDATQQLRMTVGVNPRRFQWQLSSGESFQTPEVIFTFSNEGL
jgi:alpha-galactosidase